MKLIDQRMSRLPSILILDDDEDDLFLLKQMFEETGFKGKLHLHQTPEKFISEIEGWHLHDYPSLIILDYNMPHYNGLEVLKTIKDNPFLAHIPVIIFSTGGESIGKEALKEGAILFLKKADHVDKIRNQVAYFSELVSEGSSD
jgi:CheY-like chemotaxis protein